MFLKKLNQLFLFVTVIGSIFLIYFWYDSYSFKNSTLDEKILNKIEQKHIDLENLAFKKFGIKRKIPVLISDKMPSSLFGAATYSQDGQIKIFLNKKRFKESSEYMINDVLPHEYAHALMFVKRRFTNKNGGHTITWQRICLALEGLKCDRFVDHNDVIMGKTNFF